MPKKHNSCNLKVKCVIFGDFAFETPTLGSLILDCFISVRLGTLYCPPPECACKLQWPASSNLGNSCTFFFGLEVY